MRFVNYQYGGEPLLELMCQKSVQSLQQAGLAEFCDSNAQVRGGHYQKIYDRQPWSKDVGESDSLTFPNVEQTSHNHGLSRPYFAGQDNESFAECYGVGDRCDSLPTGT